MQMMKSKLAKAAVVGGVGLGMVGLGAGAASAQPGPAPVPGQQHNQGPQHNNPAPQQHPGGHGFWFFNHWVPTPW